MAQRRLTIGLPLESFASCARRAEARDGPIQMVMQMSRIYEREFPVLLLLMSLGNANEGRMPHQQNCKLLVRLYMINTLGPVRFLLIFEMFIFAADTMTDSTELTTRDVLHQVDRRLTRIEDDLRSLDAKVDGGFERFDAKSDSGFGRLDEKFDSGFARLDEKIDNVFGLLNTKIDTGLARTDDKFRWTHGLIFVSWLSLMGAILLK